MSIYSQYRCNGIGCSATKTMTGGPKMPPGWTKAHAFLGLARRSRRPVRHFCPMCTIRRDQQRTTLGHQRLRVK